MDYKELLKKYWFVGLIGIVLIVFVGIYAADAYKNRELTVSSKQVDGKYAVYSVDGEYVFADDFYDSLFKKNGLNCEYVAYQRAVLSKAYETTDDMNTVAANYASYMYQQYGEEYIISQLQQMGYVDGSQDLTNYYIDSQKRDLLIGDYLKAHADETIVPYQEENNGRVIYHILVKVADITSTTDEEGNVTYTANPTEEESKKLQDVLDALKNKPFQEVASAYSDDTSAQYGGYIGYISNANASNYFPIFSSTSLALADDEVSEVVTSSAGYHITWNAGSSPETLCNDTEFITQIEQANPTIALKAVVDKGNELGFEIVDEELMNLINSQIESGEQE